MLLTNAFNIIFSRSVRVLKPSLLNIRRYPAPRKKFYKNVFVSESNGGYEINLDKRKLKTPFGHLLKLPNEGLATAVANEWDMQNEHIEQHNMHLTNLCNTVIDNPLKTNKEGLINTIVEYLETDTLCYRIQEPPELSSLQINKWDPVVEWFKNQFEVKICASENLLSSPVPQETVEKMKNYLLSFNMWSLAGMNFTAENLKSLTLTLAIINQKLDIEMAVELSRLEVLFQTQKWGSVEWSHDLELKQTTARVAAGTLFVYLNEETTHFTKKAATTME